MALTEERGGPALWAEWRRNTALGASGLGCFILPQILEFKTGDLSPNMEHSLERNTNIAKSD